MKQLKKIFIGCLSCLCMVALMCSCDTAKSGKQNQEGSSKDQLNVVATIFPQYDFLRQIGGEHINLSMLLTPGGESHTFEPTPQDIKEVADADLVVYVGGDSDEWVKDILESVDQQNIKTVKLMDCVEVVEEESVEGMMTHHHHHDEDADHEEHEHDHDEDADHEEHEHDHDENADHEEHEHDHDEDVDHEEHEHEHEEDADHEEHEHDHGVEYDEHVWTSPQNAILIVQKLCDTLCSLDAANAEDYKKNAAAYITKLEGLDQEFKDVVASSTRKEIIVGDRFPFRYFVDAYGLSYYAAFPGCASETEADASTLAFLIDKVKEDQIPMVFHIELSNDKVCKTICEETGAKQELLNAAHNISKEDFEAGVTYMDLMEHNTKVLKEALN